MIRVFNGYDECALAWARQQQDSGRTRGNRMYFEGPTIYSYGSHFPMAKIIPVPAQNIVEEFASALVGENRNVALLVNDGSYSVTTSRHQRAMNYAIQKYLSTHPSFYVCTRTLRDWGWNKAIGRGLLYGDYMSRLREALEDAAKPRIRQKTRDATLARAMHYVTEANRFARLFGDPAPFPTNEAEALAVALTERPQGDHV